jgi:hypothetical protein
MGTFLYFFWPGFSETQVFSVNSLVGMTGLRPRLEGVVGQFSRLEGAAGQRTKLAGTGGLR